MPLTYQMNQQLSSWIVISFSILGISAAIIAFLKTPKEKRGIKAAFRLNYSAEERFKACPAKAEAVIIKSNKKLALIKAFPYLIVPPIFTAFALWMKSVAANGCARLFDINIVQLSLILLCYVLPIEIFIGSLIMLKIGIKTLKTGYFPPLDTVVFFDTVSTKGFFSISRGLVAIIFPLLAAICVYFGNNLYQELNQGSAAAMTKLIESKCTSIIQLP
jgi:hypothetical protein